MTGFLVSRGLQAVLVLFCVITVTFFAIRVIPGGPFDRERMPEGYIKDQLEAAYGLDRPVVQQYFAYLGGLARLDLGPSLKFEGRTVGEIIREAFPVSLQLGMFAMVVAVLIGVPLGALAAGRHGTGTDHALMSAAMLGICLPTFVLGPVLALTLGLWLNWFNVSGLSDLSDWVMPSLTLGLFYAAYIARLTRGSMLEVLNQDYIRTARAKGLAPLQVLWKHGLRAALPPVVSYLGPAFAGMITGSLVIERVFNIPGLGQHFISSAHNRDYTLILGTVIVYASLIVLMNLIADLMLAWLNPKVRLWT